MTPTGRYRVRMDAIEDRRRIPFTAMFNFRDVGGYRGLDGRTVRSGRLYRSDSLHRMDGADQDAFSALGVRTVVDLRRPQEVQRDGRVPELDGLVYRHIHPEHADWTRQPYQPDSDLARYLADRYADLARTGTAGLAQAIGLIADSANAPVVVHCVAGKDRTGIVCGLTLAALGVEDAEIAADYALSNEASQRFAAWLATAYPHMPELPAPFLSSPAETMLLFLAEIREGHGSIDGYLRHTGVTDDQLAALRTHLLV
ncbi:tyrosine-protein phosphatase [Micromonospora sp. NPDC051196]|uniref:tyrosine-protein phosphatase n=1 Tax=Micromonospora sp. NPDC051196 TaxID=3155281 RepID=UPI0034286A1A